LNQAIQEKAISTATTTRTRSISFHPGASSPNLGSLSFVISNQFDISIDLLHDAKGSNEMPCFFACGRLHLNDCNAAIYKKRPSKARYIVNEKPSQNERVDFQNEKIGGLIFLYFPWLFCDLYYGIIYGN
jgi:hypothetical protein